MKKAVWDEDYSLTLPNCQTIDARFQAQYAPDFSYDLIQRH